MDVQYILNMMFTVGQDVFLFTNGFSLISSTSLRRGQKGQLIVRLEMRRQKKVFTHLLIYSLVQVYTRVMF